MPGHILTKAQREELETVLQRNSSVGIPGRVYFRGFQQRSIDILAAAGYVERRLLLADGSKERLEAERKMYEHVNLGRAETDWHKALNYFRDAERLEQELSFTGWFITDTARKALE